MAYDSDSLVLESPRLGEGEGPLASGAGFTGAKWVYRSADPVATVIAAGYVSDGDDKGVKVYDRVEIIDDNLNLIDLALVTVVDAAGLVTMINGT